MSNETYDQAGHAEIAAHTRKRIDEYAEGRRVFAPLAFEALERIVELLPANPTGTLVLGFITGVLSKPHEEAEE
jgi:hypothetical protein